MFEKSTWIRLPRNVVIGHSVLDQTVEAISDIPLTGRPLIVTSPTPKRIAGNRLVELFTEEGIDAETIVVEEASFESIENVIETAHAEEVDYFIGVGGGKPIDIAKMGSDELDVGFVSVPTAASHDGIISGRASIPEGALRHSVAADPPLAVIADTEILADAPWELTTAGCADIISNYTAVKDWRLARRLQNVEYSENAAALSEMTAEMIVDDASAIRPGLEESAWDVITALVSSGIAMSIANSSRPASGAEHLFSHQLDRIAPGRALHGHQVGVGTIVVEFLHSGERGEWTTIRDGLMSIGAPTTAEELGITDEEVIEAFTTAHKIRDRFTILGDGITATAAQNAATTTGVI